MAASSVVLTESGVRIQDLDVPRKDVADFLTQVAEEERDTALLHAIEVGVFCLQRARAGQDMEFVKRQVDSLLREVEKAVGSIPDATQRALVEKIGTGEGQVLAPVQMLMNEAFGTVKDRLTEVRELLQHELDPSKQTSTLGKALGELKLMLDPSRKDSIQGSLDAVLRSVTAKDGALAESVKAVVTEAVKPLAKEVDDLANVVRGQEAQAEALAGTTKKGAPYEEEVVGMLQSWATVTGAEVHHLGPDNRAGDVVIRIASGSFGETPLTIVVEAKDYSSPLGRKAITDQLSFAMAERDANAAIWVSHTRAGLAKDVGEWCEGTTERGPFVATTHEHLTVAVRFLIAQQRLASLRASRPEVDSATVEIQVGRMSIALKRVTTINSRVTDVRQAAQSIQDEAEALRTEIREALIAIEDAIRKVTADAASLNVA